MKKTLYFLFTLTFIAITFAKAQDSGSETQAGDSSVAIKKIPELQQKDFQFTFMFPPFSTNWIQNSKTVNKVSLNLFVGNAGGVDGVEGEVEEEGFILLAAAEPGVGVVGEFIGHG